MFKGPFNWMILLKIIVVIFAFNAASVGEAEAKKADQCSALNQKPCPVYYPGEQCDKWLSDQGGKCRPCGGEGQKACPKIKSGYPCKGQLRPNDNGVCVACGGAGQQPCRTFKPGPKCAEGSVEIGGRCTPCGGLRQRACPTLASGYPCKGKLEPNSNNICTPCGGDGQKACRAFKPGEQCDSGLDKDRNNICRPCGGQGEPACSITKSGTICESGLGQIDGVCRPCGRLNQPACPALEVGRQCQEWTTNRDGVCRPCGTPATGACRITDKGSACEDIYDWEFGKCVESVRSITRGKASDAIQQLGGDLLARSINFAADMDEDDQLKGGLGEGELNSMPSNKLCLGQNETSDWFHRSWSLGVGAGAGVGIGKYGVGADGEVGAVWRCAFRDDTKDTKWYASGGWSKVQGGSAGAGVTFGMWKPDFNSLRGGSHGFVLSVSDIAKGAAWLKGVDLGKASLVDAAIGIWFAENPDGSVGDYAGYTITIGAGAGVSIGYYINSKTVQFCDYDMGCALNRWREVRDSGAFVNNGVIIDVLERDKDGITVNITRDGVVEEGVYFERHTITDKRDYQRKDGKNVTERICFRSNFTKLKFRDGDGNCDRGSTLVIDGDAVINAAIEETASRSDRPASPAPVRLATTDLDTRGLWDFEVNGETYTDEFIEQTADYVILRRYGTTQNRRYDRVGENKYQNERGATFRFVSATRGVWISPEGDKTYQLKKR